MTFAMKIQNYVNENGAPVALGSITTWHDSGYLSPQDAIREIRRRFKHRNPRPWRNGLELDGDAGTFQRIWFEER